MTAMIEVSGIVKRFDDLKAVDDVSFTVERGEVFGLLGPNGAGKTTLISMLTTLKRPTSGTGRIGGHDVAKEAAAVRDMIGLVPQALTSDVDMTGWQNMMLVAQLYHVPKAETKARCKRLLELVELDDAAERKVITYSGGMRKRLEMAMGLIHSPKVLFLDEPTLGLDIQTRTALWRYIDEVRRKDGTTILLTTHYLEEADQLCDRIAIVDKGRIVAMGSPEGLKQELGGDVVRLRATGDGDLEGSITALDGVLSVTRDGDEYSVRTRDGDSMVASLVSVAIDRGMGISSVTVAKPNLDQVFLEYTGRSMRDEDSNTNHTVQANRMRQHGFGGGRR